MIDYVKKILAGQIEASLCMVNEWVQKCPPDQWDGKIARHAFCYVAYHTPCFVDLSLAPNEETFQPGFHPQEWNEPYPSEFPSRRFDRTEITEYLAICRQKAKEILASETRDPFERESGFHWLPFSCGKLHVSTISVTYSTTPVN